MPARFRILTEKDIGPLHAWTPRPVRLERGQLVAGSVALNDPRAARRFLAVLELSGSG